MIKHKTRVKETASNKPNASTAFNLPGSAATGYRTFASAYANTDQLPYHATNGTDWESGIATFTTGSPNTLVRSVIYESSNSDAAVVFSAGANVELFVEWPAKLAEMANTPPVVIIRNDGTTVQNNFTASAFTKVAAALTTVVVNHNNWWDTTNKKFLPTLSGHYLIIFGVQMDSLADGKSAIAVIRKNNVDYAHLARGWMSTATGVIGVSGSCVVQCNGTSDYIEAFVWQNDTVTRSTFSGAERTFFMAQRIGDL